MSDDREKLDQRIEALIAAGNSMQQCGRLFRRALRACRLRAQWTFVKIGAEYPLHTRADRRRLHIAMRRVAEAWGLPMPDGGTATRKKTDS